MTNLLTKSLPITGIVAYNDYMAAGALSVLDENGIQGDRGWALFDVASDLALTARRQPELLYAAAAIGDQPDRLKQIVNQHRLEDIQFHMALRAGKGDGGVIAHHLGANHDHRLTLSEIHLPRHHR